MQTNKKFTILITTKNRKDDLAFTLRKIQYLLDRDDVACIICDDGSTDETCFFIKESYPNIQFIQNAKSEGLIVEEEDLYFLFLLIHQLIVHTGKPRIKK